MGSVLSKAQAREEVARNAGTQFDPVVVKAFLSAVEALDA